MIIIAAIALGAVIAAHTVPFPFLMEAFRPSGSLWRVKPVAGAPPTIFLTFDDGPNAVWTPALLDALRETGASATFFLIDDHITDATIPIVQRISDEGHAIGVHTGSRHLISVPPQAVVEYVEAAAGRIETITGRPPCRLFRPHAGWRSPAMYVGLKRANYRLAGWSWGMWDWDWWSTPRGDTVAQRLLRKASAGDIAVIHDGHHKNPAADRRHAADTVRRLVPALRQRGFSFGRLCEP